MKVYLDNVAASGWVVDDLVPSEEMEAVRQLATAAQAGELELVTSRESWREQERTKDLARRAKLQAARAEIPTVQHDHALLGFNTVYDHLGGFVSSPLITDIVDEKLFVDLKGFGLKDADARHLMYAATNGCDRFVTLDPDFLNRRAALEARCPSVRIQKPTETTEEVRARARSGGVS